MPSFKLLFTSFLLALSLSACRESNAASDAKLYGPWQFSGCSYKTDGVDKTSVVDGEIDLGKDGQCHGQRIIGTIVGPLDGPYTVNGNHLTLKAESDVTYTWAITEGDLHGTPVWILALDNGTMTYRLVRKR